MNKPITPEEMKAYVDATWEKCQAQAWLEQPAQQEPVAVVGTDVGGTHLMYGSKYVGTTPDKKTAIFFKDVPVGTALYTRPQAREWMGLTDKEMRDALRQLPDDTEENLRIRWRYAKDFVRAIEAKLREKNT